MNKLTYPETLEYMYSQLPMFQKIGSAAYKDSLDNITALCEAIGNPQDKIKTVHIAGTNGKGTVSHLIAYGLQQQGLKVGLYTSPHYKDFRERIKINGALATKKFVQDFIYKHKALIETISPSFFEITVAMAFDYFANQNVDVAIIEVGLGGRLDSTNIITPLLSVITNISFDHTGILGHDLVSIAKEKAGIIKNEIPVLIGENQVEVQLVFESVSKIKNAKRYQAGELIYLEETNRDLTSRNLKIQIDQLIYNFESDLMANYHDLNIKTAFAALHLLQQHFTIDFNKIFIDFIDFALQVKYMGRWQIISKNPLIIMDSAHNEAGIKLAVDLLSKFKNQNLRIVIGFAKDKDFNFILPLLPKKASYYFVNADSPRSIHATTLKDLAQLQGLTGKAYSSVKAGLNAAKRASSPNDVIFCGGSIFVLAEILP
jgi:dihydrofolate synthase / folylpolyglutamate synthase